MKNGSVAEWLKAHDSKSCGQKCLGGSNPLASAKMKQPVGLFFDCIYFLNRNSNYRKSRLFAAFTSKDDGESFEEDFNITSNAPMIDVETI